MQNSVPDKFRVAYVVCNSGHDISALKPLCEVIVFCTTGYEEEDAVIPTLMKALKPFDPEKDVLVPLGSITHNMLAGAIVALKTASIWCDNTDPEVGAQLKLGAEFFSTHYHDKMYDVYRVKVPTNVPLMPLLEVEEPS